MQAVASEDIGGERVDGGLNAKAVAPTQPDRVKVSRLNLPAGEDLGLAVKRQVIVILRDDYMGEQPGTTVSRERAISP
jgi:hypothetical protein